MNLKKIPVSFYKRTAFTEDDPDRAGVEVSVFSVLAGIKNRKWREEIRQLREAAGNDAQEKRLKKLLPAVTFAGTFTDFRQEKNLSSYTNIMVIDIDNISDMSRVSETLLNDPYVLSMFVSPRGNGIKVLLKTSCTPEQHRAMFETARIYFEKKHEVAVDVSGKDPARLTYISDDENLYCNPNSRVMKVDEYFLKPQPKKRSYTTDMPATDVEYIFMVCKIFADRKGNFVTGNRNNYIFALSAILNRCGIDKEDAWSLINSNFLITPEKEWRTCLESAYKKTEQFGTVEIQDFRSKNNIQIEEKEKYNADESVEANMLIDYITELIRSEVPHTTIKALAERFWEGDYKTLDRIYGNALERAKIETLAEGKTSVINKPEDDTDDIFYAYTQTSFITSGHHAIDELWGGVNIGNLYGFIGMDETYKSFMAMECMVRNLLNGIVVNYYNGEMDYKRQFYPRLFQRLFGIDLEANIKSGNIKGHTMAKYSDMMREMTKGGMHVISKAGFTHEQIRNTAIDTGASLIVIDGMRAFAGGEKIDAMPGITGSLKDVAKETSTAIVGLFHTAGDIKWWHKNANERIRGGQPVRSHLDAYLSTSKLVDGDESGYDGNTPIPIDNIKYREGEFCVRAQNKRGKGSYKDIVMVMDPTNLQVTATAFDIKNYNVNIKER